MIGTVLNVNVHLFGRYSTRSSFSIYANRLASAPPLPPQLGFPRFTSRPLFPIPSPPLCRFSFPLSFSSSQPLISLPAGLFTRCSATRSRRLRRRRASADLARDLKLWQIGYHSGRALQFVIEWTRLIRL